MSDTFNASATILQSSQISTKVFSVGISVLDYSGNHTGFDLQSGDFIFVDITNNRINNADVARYKIKTINNKNLDTANLAIEYIDSGDCPDPNDYLNQPAFVCRKLPGRYAWIASSSMQPLPEYLVTYARNLDTSQSLLISKTEYLTLIESNVTSKKVKLGGVPVSDIFLSIYGGVPAWFGDDFTVTNDELIWDGLGLDGLVTAGDRFIVSYNKYNSDN